MKLTPKSICISLIVCLLLNACIPLQQAPTPTQPPEEKDATPTFTPFPSLTPSIQSPTPSVTLSPTFRLSATVPIDSATMTLVPALPSAQAEMQFLELLKTNGDCHLPCFWGLTPGVSTMQMFGSVMNQFDHISSSDISISRDDLLLSALITPRGNYEEYKNSPSETIRWLGISLQAYKKLPTRDEQIYKSPYYSEYFQYYTLPYLLSAYGKPDQVYVFLESGLRDMGLGIDLYLLYLDYTKEGWVARLDMPLYPYDNQLIGCPYEALTNLWLWSPGDDKPASDFGFAQGTDLYSIEEATSLTLEQFYEHYKDPSNADCLKTPMDIHK